MVILPLLHWVIWVVFLPFLANRIITILVLFYCQAWPEDALEMVAKKFLAEVDLEDDLRAECVNMCKYFHEDVTKVSER